MTCGAVIRTLWAALWLALVPGLLAAQTASESVIDYEDYGRAAVAAEAALATDETTDDQLLALRGLLNSWRDQLISAQSVNAARIATLEDQLAALGPAPEEGSGVEPQEIAQRRFELQSRLAELQAPGRRASEALSEANGLIAEIDAEIRTRQAQALFSRGASPLLPWAWLMAIEDTFEAFRAISREVDEALSDPGQRDTALSRLPVSAAMVLVAVLLLGRGRKWMERLTATVEARSEMRGAVALRFAVSLGQIVIPVLGTAILVGAFFLPGFLGQTGIITMEFLLVLGTSLILARWFGTVFYPLDPRFASPLGIPQDHAREGRFHFMIYGLVLSLYFGLGQFAAAAETEAGTTDILAFPVTLLASFFLFRTGKFFASTVPAADPSAPDEGGDRGFLNSLAAVLGRLARLVAILAPLAAVAGYANLSEAMVVRSILLLALISLIALLHIVLQDLYAFATGRTEEETDAALAPVLATMAITILLLPVFALILGARWSEVTGFWLRLRQGLSIGDLTISPTAVLIMIVVFALGYGLTRFIQKTLKSTILPKTRLDAGGRNAVVSGVGYVGITIAALTAVTSAGLDLSNLAIVAGALSVGIGFGLQNIVSNFVSGIILLIERPVGEGDWIEVGSTMGIVKAISVRSTQIETFDRRDVIVPNSDLVSGTVTNWTRGNNVGRIIIRVGVGYDSNSRQVEAILREVCESHPLVALNPPPAILFRSFGDNALEFEARCILRDINFMMGVQSELHHQILERFRAENILIPFPQRDVWLRTPGDTTDIKGAQMREDFAPTALTRDTVMTPAEVITGSAPPADDRPE